MTRRFLPVDSPRARCSSRPRPRSRGSRGGWNGAGAVRSLIGVVFVALLAAHYARVSRPLLAHVEYAGLIPRLEQLAGTVGDDDLLIAESRDSGERRPRARAAARLHLRPPGARAEQRASRSKPAFAAFLESARTRYRRVLFIGGGGTDLLSYRYGVRSLASERFQVPEYDAPINALPRFVRQKEFDFGVYEFTPPDPRTGLWFDLDVGLRDDLHMLRFHAKEQTEGRSFRWTRDDVLRVGHGERRRAREVTLWMNDGGRPKAWPAGRSQRVSAQSAARLDPASDRGSRPTPCPFRPDLAKRAADFGDPVELRLVTPTWNPHDVLGTPDDRDLGVMVDRVAVK